MSAALKKPAAALSRSRRTELRADETESALKRPPGPKRKRQTAVSDRQLRRRNALDQHARMRIKKCALY